MAVTPQDGGFPQMHASDASVPYESNQEPAKSYGYQPWKIPTKQANAESAQPDQDIDPSEAANNVLERIKSIEENRQERAAGRATNAGGGGEVVFVGDAQPKVKRHGAFEGPRRAAEEAVQA